MGYPGTIGKTNWTLGELSPRTFGRFDADKPIYKNGAAIIENWLVTKAGGVMYRPGTRYVAKIKNPTDVYTIPPVRFERFRYSIDEEYILEIGDQYMRFYANSGQVTVLSVPVEITTPYARADIFQLNFANKADVMYITHINYPTQKLIRTSANSFVLFEAPFVRGPFMDTNVNNVTITPSSATGNTTLTATVPAWLTATLYLPGDYVTEAGSMYICQVTHTAGVFATDLAAGYWKLRDFFQTGHVGALYLVNEGVVKITGYTSSTIVAGDVQAEPDGTAGDLGTTSATLLWAEGEFSAVRGYASACTFHEQRLVLGKLQKFFGSVIGAPDNFDSGGKAGQTAVTDSNAYIYEIASNLTLDIRWMVADTSLKIGTGGGTVTANDGSALGITPLSPPSIVIDTDYAVQQIEPERIGGYAFYMQANSFILSQLVFDLIVSRDKSDEMTLLSDHILRDGGGVRQIARQQSPTDRIWCVRNDGQLAVFTRNVDQQVLGWSRCVLGNTAYGPGQVESIAILPLDGADDQIWVVVKRIVNGVTTRFVEYFTEEMFDKYWEPIRLDSSLSLNSPITITAITNANPCQITSPSHGLSTGDQIKIDDITTYEYIALVDNLPTSIEVGMSELNTNVYKVVVLGVNTFTLTTTADVAINSTDFNTYIGGGAVRKMRTVFTGLDHLNGEYVSVMADGALPAAQQTFLVSSGTITLPNPAAVVHAGLPYIGVLKLLPLGGDSNSITQTKKRKLFQVNAKVWKSLGGYWGDTIEKLSPIVMPNQIANLPAYHANEPYTGNIMDLPMESYESTSWEPVLVCCTPLPFMLLALVFRSELFEDK